MKANNLITIFTPTYNRAYILFRLYESLKIQTDRRFEWIIVDDGSTDNTEDLISLWLKSDNDFPIKYVRQPNGGKHRAINRGVEEASGNLFFIVDSDDYVTPDAIECINREWEMVEDKSKMAGLCFRKVNVDTLKVIGKPFPQDRSNASSLTICYKWGIKGDKAEIFRTDILRKNRFPDIKGEKFITEAAVWNKIALSSVNLLRCVEQSVYMAQYQRDGLTSNYMDIIRKNPQGYIVYYHSLLFAKQVWYNPMDIFKILIRLLQCYYYTIIKWVG